MELQFTALKYDPCSSMDPAAPIWDGLLLYIVNDLERIQGGSLRITGKKTEINTSENGYNNPCYVLVPVAHKHDYVRSKNNSSSVSKITSRIKRHHRASLNGTFNICIYISICKSTVFFNLVNIFIRLMLHSRQFSTSSNMYSK